MVLGAMRKALFPWRQPYHHCSHLPLIPRRRESTKNTQWSADALLALLDDVKQDITDIQRPAPQEASNSNAPGQDASGQSPPRRIPELPLSPLIDPRLISARERYRLPKPLPNGQLSLFSQRLSKNVYAQALGKPVRRCNLTNARLPTSFLVRFGIAKHPKTGEPWHLPSILVDSASENAHGNPSDGENVSFENKTTTSEDEGPAENVSENELSEQNEKNKAPNQDPIRSKAPNTSASVPKPVTRNASGSYYLNSYSTLQRISRMEKREYLRTITLRWRDDAGIEVDKLVWRQDMETFVLKLLRRKLHLLLQSLALKATPYVVPCHTYFNVNKISRAGAVLWMGDVTVKDDDADDDADAHDHPPSDPAPDFDPPSPASSSTGNSPPCLPLLESKAPPPYSTIPHKKSLIPLYNLPALLGPKHVHDLQLASSKFRSKIVIVRKKPEAMSTLTDLWNLERYLAPDE